MIVDSFYVIKRPHFSCYGGCGKVIWGGIEGMDLVVLEYKPTSTLLFLCTECAGNRNVLDHLAERLSENIDRDVVIDVDRNLDK